MCQINLVLITKTPSFFIINYFLPSINHIMLKICSKTNPPRYWD